MLILDAFEAEEEGAVTGAQAWGALGARRRLVELRLLPRDRASIPVKEPDW